LKTHFYIFALAFGASIIGCAQVQTAPQRGAASVNTQSVMPVVKNSANKPDSGVVFSYTFVGGTMPADGSCRVRFIKKDSGKSTIANLKSADTASFSALAPGLYDMGRMGCGLTRVYEMTDLYPNGFRVEAGKASYLGKIIFKFEGNDLKEVNKASRSDSALAFGDISAAVPPGTPIVSAFTLAQITNEMAEAGGTTAGFTVRAKGMQGPALDQLLADLQGCEKKVAATDPLRFGTLDYTAAYKAGRFWDLKERHDTNAFPETLRDCVSETLSAFTPNAKTAVEVRVVY
jgi:hypothetical protein